MNPRTVLWLWYFKIQLMQPLGDELTKTAVNGLSDNISGWAITKTQLLLPAVCLLSSELTYNSSSDAL